MEMYLSPTANGWEINSHKSKYPDIKNTTDAANTYLCLQHFFYAPEFVNVLSASYIMALIKTEDLYFLW